MHLCRKHQAGLRCPFLDRTVGRELTQEGQGHLSQMLMVSSSVPALRPLSRISPPLFGLLTAGRAEAHAPRKTQTGQAPHGITAEEL